MNKFVELILSNSNMLSLTTSILAILSSIIVYIKEKNRRDE